MTNINEKKKDAFLLELNKNNGSQRRFEVFGLQFSTDNGALQEGRVQGNLDLHLTRDRHAVIIGNTEYPRFSPNRPDKKYPYLIERYDTIEDTCVDVVKEVKKKTYKTQMEKVNVEEIGVKPQQIKVKRSNQKIDRRTPCPKESSPTEPTENPTISPNQEPTPVFFPTLPVAPFPFSISVQPAIIAPAILTKGPKPTQPPLPLTSFWSILVDRSK